MPVAPTYPGVYVQEIPSGVRTITGVATSVTAFIGRTLRGPVNKATTILSYGDFERQFGGLWVDSTMSYAIQHYFQNGGTTAIIVRIAKGAATAKLSLPATGSNNGLEIEASSPGSWGKDLRIEITYVSDSDDLFNLTVREVEPNNPDVARSVEIHRNLSVELNAVRYVGSVLEQDSQLIKVSASNQNTSVRPNETIQSAIAPDPNNQGADGSELTTADYQGNENDKTGIHALRAVDLFNILCIPPYTRDNDVDVTLWGNAQEICKEARAILIVDAPSSWKKPSDVTEALAPNSSNSFSLSRDTHTAVYFPRLQMADPLQENRLEEFAPCGVVAGIIARTDAQRGVWKAPAGTEASLLGVRQLSLSLTDGENGQLNPLAVNCLRTLPVYGHVVWGARTWAGEDQLASEWKYLPVRRLALFLEESLYRSLQWVVFEPNDAPLWAQIRLNVGAFMQNLFLQGAFQGSTPREAYLVKCDRETTTQNDINLGIVNIVVGFAPLKPAEFVFIKLQQLAGQVQA